MKNTKIYKYPIPTTANSDPEIILSVKEFIKEFICAEIPDFSVIRDENGKPYIVGIDGIFVSVAHDGDVCLVAVSQEPIGIDIERADRRVRNPIEIARRYFCEDEIAFLGENPQISDFTDMWVRKEALSKLIGRGVPCMKEKSILSRDVVIDDITDFEGYVVKVAHYAHP